MTDWLEEAARQAKNHPIHVDGVAHGHLNAFDKDGTPLLDFAPFLADMSPPQPPDPVPARERLSLPNADMNSIPGKLDSRSAWTSHWILADIENAFNSLDTFPERASTPAAFTQDGEGTLNDLPSASLASALSVSVSQPQPPESMLLFASGKVGTPEFSLIDLPDNSSGNMPGRNTPVSGTHSARRTTPYSPKFVSAF